MYMLCQNCKINESTIHLYTNVNGRQQQVDLCQNCYKIMKTDPNNLKPLQLNPEAVMEVAATAKTITVVAVKTLVKHALRSQKDC